jgi:hypothetical protein
LKVVEASACYIESNSETKRAWVKSNHKLRKATARQREVRLRARRKATERQREAGLRVITS